MNRIITRLLILTLLLLMVLLISSCGNQPNGVNAQQDHSVAAEGISAAKDAPATVALDEEAPENPANEDADAPPKDVPTEVASEVASEAETPATEQIPASTNGSPATESSTEQPPEPITSVMISIVGDEKKGVILEPTSMEWQYGDDVLDVLKRVTKRHRIPLEYRGSGMLSYVEGIANLYEFDQGAGSGWLFKVNGQFAEKSAGAVKLNKGDVVEWIYSIGLSEEPDN